MALLPSQTRRNPGGLTLLSAFTSRLRAAMGALTSSYPAEKKQTPEEMHLQSAKTLDELAHAQDEINRRLFYAVLRAQSDAEVTINGTSTGDEALIFAMMAMRKT